jgi:hypothetical protein
MADIKKGDRFRHPAPINRVVEAIDDSSEALSAGGPNATWVTIIEWDDEPTRVGQKLLLNNDSWLTDEFRVAGKAKPGHLRIDITMPFEVAADDIDMMIDTNIYRQSSPWISRIDRREDKGIDNPRWKVWYDGEDDDEGSFASTGVVFRSDLLTAFGKAAADQWQGKHFGLCCLDEMLKEKSLAIGCAQDSDVVMQYALLKELVYG